MKAFMRDLRRWWREPPAIASADIVKLCTGGFYICAAVIGALAALLSPDFGGRRVELAILFVISVAVGGVVLGYGHLLTRRHFHLNALNGLGCAIAFMLLADPADGGSAAALGAPLLFILVNTGFLFSLRGASLHIGLTLGIGIPVMLYQGAPVASVLLIQGCGLSIALMTAWLARMADIAEEDALTRLYNRRGFDRQLEESVAKVTASGGTVSLALFDIDHFKSINDSEGHSAGDRVLVECARVWSAAIPSSASLTRYGGDEFALLMPGIAAGNAADLVDVLRELTPIGVTVSAGVAGWSPGDGESDFFRNADLALYDAKMSGRNQTVSYGDPNRAASHIERAIAKGEMFLEFQPICNVAGTTVEISGYEALVRWQHPESGRLLPDKFVPVAERTGAIRPLGLWVLREVLRLASENKGSGIVWAVNVSVVQLRSAGFVELVGHALSDFDVPPRSLVLEITESVFDEGEQIERAIQDLREMGVRIAMDDFGAGHSSLRRLATLPIDVLKLDGGLMDGIHEGSFDAPILQAIVAMARSLGVRVVAEHVETRHQLEVIHRLGFDWAQGYFVGRPERWGEASLRASQVGVGQPAPRSPLSARLTARASLRRPADA